MNYILRFGLIGMTICLLGELIVRTLITSPEASIVDHELGWRYKPHSTIFQTTEGWAVNKINSLGFNDEELSPDNTKQRLLILGDSITEALQVSQQKNFTSLIEKNAGCVESFNGGRGGLSPIHYPIIERRLHERFLPDMIVVVVTYSDYSDINSNTQNYIVRDPVDGKIVDIVLKERKLQYLRIKLNFLFSNSSLFTYLKNRLRAIKRDTIPVIAKIDHNDSQQRSQIDPKMITEILSYVFLKLNKAEPLYVLYIPNLKYLPDGLAEPEPESEEFEEIVKIASIDSGVPFLSAYDYMAESYANTGRPPVGFQNSNMLYGHLNETGHQAIASAILELTKIDCPNNDAPSNISE